MELHGSQVVGKRLLLKFPLAAICLAFAASAQEPTPAETAVAALTPAPAAASGGLMVQPFEYRPKPKTAEECQGSSVPENCDPVVVAAKTFTIQVPQDWDVKSDQYDYAIFMEPKVKMVPTLEHPIVMNPNITVSVTTRPMPIDEEALGEFLLEIEKNIKKVNGENSKFQIIQKSVYEGLPGGRKGLLYYIASEANGVPVGQAILVMSNEKALFRITLTDHQSFLDKNLERFFPVMASLEISGAAATRETALAVAIPYALPVFGVFGILWFALWFRQRRMNRLMQEFSIDGPNSKLDFDAEPPEEGRDNDPEEIAGGTEEKSDFPPYEDD